MTESGSDNLTWHIVDRRDPIDFGVFKLRQHSASDPLNGEQRTFSVVDIPDWVNVIALTESDEVVAIRQFRHGVERVTLEIPGGVVEVGEEALDAAKRELREETGYVADDWSYLGRVEPNPAIQSNRCDLFLALDARPEAEVDFDPSEVIEVQCVPLVEFESLIRSGRVSHALVVAAFAHLLIRAGGWRRPCDDDADPRSSAK